MLSLFLPRKARLAIYKIILLAKTYSLQCQSLDYFPQNPPACVHSNLKSTDFVYLNSLSIQHFSLFFFGGFAIGFMTFQMQNFSKFLSMIMTKAENYTLVSNKIT